MNAYSQEEKEINIKDISHFFLKKPITRVQLLLTLKKLFPFTEIKPITTVAEDNISKLPLISMPTSPELLAKLHQQKAKVWHNLRKTMITKELRQFSRQLQRWGEEYHCQTLIDYANCLKKQLQEFDSDKLAKTLEKFPNLVRSLQ